MTDPTIDDPGQQSDPGQQNAVTDHWYDSFAGDDPARQEQLSKFDSFDSFLEDYNAAKNADWRDGIAGDDDKFKSTLQRFSTPQDFGNSYREAQQKIRSGQLRPELPEDASEEQIKEYRQANNIPIEVEGYLENLPDGLVVGDEDKEIMLDFLGAMHEVNAPKAVADKMVAWYNDFEQRQQDAIAELDAEQAREATDMLRDSENGWGNDFRTNMNLINSVLETHFGEEAKAQLLNGRYQDGRGFFNDPNVLKGLASLAAVELKRDQQVIEKTLAAAVESHQVVDLLAGLVRLQPLDELPVDTHGGCTAAGPSTFDVFDGNQPIGCRLSVEDAGFVLDRREDGVGVAQVARDRRAHRDQVLANRVTFVHGVERSDSLDLRRGQPGQLGNLSHRIVAHVAMFECRDVQQRHRCRTLLGVPLEQPGRSLLVLLAPVGDHRSTSPSTGSNEASVAITSATMRSVIITGSD